ncbi:MAG: leucine-rich repeat domain-containing protein, partial [Paludibacteraceae bacterium]
YLTVPEGELIFPESITVKDQLLDVVAIGDSAFLGTKVTKIVLPSSVVSIGKAAFRNIVTTFTIELNEGLIEIGDRAFTNSTGMVGTLTLPSTLKSIYSSAALRNVAVDAIEVKAKDAPVFLSNEHKVHPLPDVPINIPCESWKNYARVNSNGSTWNAYKSRLTDPCTKLVDNYYYTATDSGAVVVGYDVAPAGILTFPTTVTINELPFNVVAIGDFAFDAMKITSLEIPSSIVYLGKGAFRKCVNLSTVTLNEGLRNIDDSCFYGCTFTAIQMPRTLKQIGKYAFRTNTELTTIVLNEGLEIIGERAFTGNTALKDTLVIPSTVKEFGAATFTNCNLISCVIFKGMTPPNVVNEGDRNPIFSNPEVRYIIPCGAMDNYKNAYYWKNLSSRFVSACKPLILTKGVALTQDTIVSSIAYSRTFDMDVWQTLYLPFEVDSVLVEEIYEGEPYYFDINEPYDPAIGGYFYLNKFDTIDENAAIITFTTATTLAGFTPYLIQFPQISSNGYFDGKNIIFKSKPGEYTLKKSDYTQPDATKQFQISGNSSVYNQSVSDMYTFRATLVTGEGGTPLKTVDGKDSVKYDFNRQASATLKPFEFGLLPCVVEPSSGISSAPKRMSLRIGRSSGNTGGGDITTSVSETHAPNAITYRTGAGELALRLNGLPCQLYSVSGTLLYSSAGGTEEITIPLEKGIYILYSEGKSQKIVL